MIVAPRPAFLRSVAAVAEAALHSHYAVLEEHNAAMVAGDLRALTAASTELLGGPSSMGNKAHVPATGAQLS